MLTNEEAFWEEKAKGWIHTKVPRPEANPGDLRKHYVNFYKQNQTEERRKKDEAEKARKTREWDKKKKKDKKLFLSLLESGMYGSPYHLLYSSLYYIYCSKTG